MSRDIIPAEVRSHRFIELDSLRGIAAFIVVCGHFEILWGSSRWYSWVDRSPLRVLFAGHEAVVLFFVLSGFVLSIPLSADHPVSYPTFLVKRFCRIYLPYAAAVLAAALGSFFLYSKVNTGNAWIDQTWSVRPTLALVLGTLLTIPASETQLNTAIWTLIVEIRVSVIFPLLFRMARRINPFLFLGSLALLAGILPLLPHGNSLAGRTVAPAYIAMFVAGTLMWKHLEKVTRILNRIGPRGRGLVLLLSLFLLFVPHGLDAWFAPSLSMSFYALQDIVIGAGAVGLIACAIHGDGLRSFLRHPVLVHVGALSYSTYLMHPTVLFVLIRLFYGKFPFYYLLPLYLLGVYLVSELFHFLIDQPSVMLGRRAGKRTIRRPEAVV